MWIWLKEPYTGKVTNHKQVEAGVHDMDNTAGAYLIENRPDIAQLVDEDFVPPVIESVSYFPDDEDGPTFLLNPPAHMEEEAAPDMPSNHPIGNQFLCCNKDWKNQGKVNFHHRNKNCPCHKE